jgi:putative flippase GtrA
VGVAILLTCYTVLRWPAPLANVTSFAVAGVLSYVLYRRWTFLRKGRSSLTREVLPYFLLSLVNLALSTWFAQLGNDLGRQVDSNRAALGGFVLVAVILGNLLAVPIKYVLCRWIFAGVTPLGLRPSGEVGITALTE